MNKIIGLCGFKGSGKDTVGNCLTHHNFNKDSFAAPLKDICSILFGWDRQLLEGNTTSSRIWRETTDEWWANKLEIPNFSPRLAMQLVGTDALRSTLSKNIWVVSLEHRLNTYTSNTVIVDCRFPNEMDLIKNQGGYIFWVKGEIPSWYEQVYPVSVQAYQNHLNGNSNANIQDKIIDLANQGIHASEWMWLAYPIDYTLENNGTLEDLQFKVDELIGTF